MWWEFGGKWKVNTGYKLRFIGGVIKIEKIRDELRAEPSLTTGGKYYFCMKLLHRSMD